MFVHETSKQANSKYPPLNGGKDWQQQIKVTLDKSFELPFDMHVSLCFLFLCFVAPPQHFSNPRCDRIFPRLYASLSLSLSLSASLAVSVYYSIMKLIFSRIRHEKCPSAENISNGYYICVRCVCEISRC